MLLSSQFLFHLLFLPPSWAQHPVLNQPESAFSLIVWDQVSNPYKITHKVTIYLFLLHRASVKQFISLQFHTPCLGSHAIHISDIRCNTWWWPYLAETCSMEEGWSDGNVSANDTPCSRMLYSAWKEGLTDWRKWCKLGMEEPNQSC